MKIKFPISILLALLFYSSTYATDNNRRPWEKYLNQKTIKIKIPKLKKITIKENIEIYLLQNNSLPQITLNLYFENLQAEENKNKAGLTNLWGDAIVFSGSKKFPKNILSEKLELQGSSLSFNSDLERAVFNLTNFSHYFEENMQVLESIIMNPNFNKKDLIQLKRKQIMYIKKRIENPSRLVYLLSNQLYWKNNVRSHIETQKTIKNINLADVLDFHKKAISNKKITAVLTGDFYKKKELKILIKFLKKLNINNKSSQSKILQVKNHNIPQNKTYVFDKKLTQTSILFKTKGIVHNSKDYYALKIFNFLLGGDSFNSHLMQEIRVKNGWAYSAYSYYTTNKYSGEINIFTQTANKNISNVINKIKFILDNPKTFVNKRKIAKAKFSLKNKFLFLFKNPSQTATQLLSLKWDGLKLNYLTTFLDNIDHVTEKDVLRIAKKYYKSKNFFITLVGPKKQISKQIKIKLINTKLPE